MSRLTRLNIIVPAAVILLALAGFLIWQNYFNSTSDSNESTINYDPPTDEQKNAAGTQSIKDASGDNPQADNKQPDGQKSSADVIITTWTQSGDKMHVNGYVQNVVETGGTCKLKLEKDGKAATSTRQAHANAQNTTCGQSVIGVAELSPGTWQATLSYTSDKYVGTSEAVSVEVTHE